ncbi:probable transcription factor At4g00390 [Argentina anserina]|uniref:probable transcription factor At4g00390 n=1 Tax=Argentina anserina TaxID=57926 RepID=UPI0021766294|nr:probable transcription factor At4g00390 [Potentilla anserina]
MAPPQRNHRPSSSESESESEQPNDTTVVVTPQRNTKPQKNHVKKPEASPSKPRSSSPSSGEYETRVHAVAADCKPMQDSKRPMQEAPKTRSKSAASPAAAKPGAKRPAAGGGDVEVSKASKKAKKEGKAEKKGKDAGEENEDVKKGRGLFQRLWSDEDEIKLVKGMLEYIKVKRGADPVADSDSFYEFVIPLLTVSVNKSQVQDKSRRMKKKYKNIDCNKFKPTKDHDWEVYKLMKKVWGGGGDEARKVEEPKQGDQNGTGKGKGVASSEPLKEPGSVGVGVLNGSGGFVKGLNQGGAFVKGLNENGGFLKGLNELGGWEDFVNQDMKLVDEAKSADVSGKWKELHLLELELFIKKTQVMGDQAKLILEALKSADN